LERTTDDLRQPLIQASLIDNGPPIPVNIAISPAIESPVV
jgi:hypothetical protein